MSLENMIQDVVKDNAAQLCGWTAQAKALWFGAGAVFGAIVTSFVWYFSKKK